MGRAPGTVSIERLFHARPEEVFRAWTEPGRFGRWFLPVDGFAAERVELDVRPGGAWRVELASPAGERLTIGGRYREVRPHERLAFELSWSGAAALVTVDLHTRPEGTALALRQEGLPESELAETEQAWQRCLGRISGVFDAALEHFYSRLTEFPRFRSRFGGLWPDLSDAQARIAGKQALGLLTPEDAARFRHWVEKGYVVLEQAVAPELIGRLCDEIRRGWEHGDERVPIEICLPDRRWFARMEPRYRDVPHKVLDYHAFSETARQVVFSPPIRRFLEQLFERPPLAFQSLLFRWGTEQDMHQDTAYVLLRSPMEFVGCWIALEDVEPGSGELQYYEGSHRIPEYLWFGRARAKPHEYDDDREFLRWVSAEPERAGCTLARFRPRKGDALLWHADLVHGGAERSERQRTRWSLVTHFCPVNVDPEWLGTSPSSGKLEHVPGCYYCHPLR